MKIACCLYKYFPFGGLQRDFVRISKAVEARGHQIRVYVQEWQGDAPETFEIIKVPTKGISNHSRNASYSDWVQNHLKDNPCDAVVGFNKMPGLDCYYQADTCYAQKVSEEKGFFYRMLGRCRHYMQFEKATFGEGEKTHLMMISDRQIPIFKQYWHTEDNRFHLLPPGISPDRKYTNQPEDIRKTTRLANKIPEDTLLILQVGSDFKRKGVDRSIQAVAALPEDIRQKTLLMVIGQDKPGQMQAQAKSLGIEQNVQFTSGRNDVAQLMASADLLMHPAYLENTGTVILEAVCAGLPVLLTDVCGYAPYIQDAQCGTVIMEPFSQSQLNQALQKILSNNVLRAKMASNARNYADSHDLYSLPEKAADIILEVAAKKRGLSV